VHPIHVFHASLDGRARTAGERVAAPTAAVLAIPEAARLPAIAVLPFDSFSSDPEQS
jgi:TolB-like protein